MLLLHRGILWQRWRSAPQCHMYHASLYRMSSPLGCCDNKVKGITGEWCCLKRKVERKIWVANVWVEQTRGPIYEQRRPTYFFHLWSRRTAHSKGSSDIFYFVHSSQDLIFVFPLYLEDEGGGALVEESGIKKRGTIWPTSLKSHCQHICHTVQLRNDCATVGILYLFI